MPCFVGFLFSGDSYNVGGVVATVDTTPEWIITSALAASSRAKKPLPPGRGFFY